MVTITHKSPITDSPFHSPGQSQDESIQRRWDSVLTYTLLASFFIILALTAWMSWISKKPLNPYLASVVALGVTAFTVYKIINHRHTIQRLRLARDGEVAVGQYLDLLRSEGAQVFHDIIAENFNLDHVLISPHGIYTVETRTYYKPARCPAVITIQDDRLLANGLEIDRNPLIQAKAQAHWLKHQLKASTGKKFHITPVIVFPGWYVEPQKGLKDVWVLNPKALPAFLSNAPLSLSQSDVYLAAYILSRYIRSQAKTA